MLLSAKNRFYATLSCFVIAGWGWLFFANNAGQPAFTPCLFKNITGLPCPSCGSTRSAVAIIHGHFAEGLALNPIGYLLTAFAFLLPLGLLTDAFSTKKKLYAFYQKFNSFAKAHPAFIISFLTLIAANWIWNICKHL